MTLTVEALQAVAGDAHTPVHLTTVQVIRNAFSGVSLYVVRCTVCIPHQLQITRKTAVLNETSGCEHYNHDLTLGTDRTSVSSVQQFHNALPVNTRDGWEQLYIHDVPQLLDHLCAGCTWIDYRLPSC